MTVKSQRVFIEHMLDSISAIKEFSKNTSLNDLLSSRIKQSAIVREIEIIGEAAKNISENLKKTHKEVPWRDIIGTRDRMIHQYFGVDMEVVWNIVKRDIPTLEKQLVKIKKDLAVAVTGV